MMAVSYNIPAALPQVPPGVILRPVANTQGKLWSCGREGQTRYVALTPDAAYIAWKHSQ